jgi:hypothetical protein
MHILTPYKSNCSHGEISKLNLFHFTMGQIENGIFEVSYYEIMAASVMA